MKRIRVIGLLALLSFVATTAQAAIWDGRIDSTGSIGTGGGTLTWNNTAMWAGDSSLISMRGPASSVGSTAAAVGTLDDIWFPVGVPAGTATGAYDSMTLANYAGAPGAGGTVNTAPANVQMPGAWWYVNDVIYGDNGQSGTDAAPGLARGIDFGVGAVPAGDTTVTGVPAAGTWYNPNGTNFVILNIPAPNATNTTGAAAANNKIIFENNGTDQPSFQVAMVNSSVSGVRDVAVRAPFLLAGDSMLIKRQGSAGTDSRQLRFELFYTPVVASNPAWVNSNVATQTSVDMIISNVNAAGTGAATNALDAIVFGGPTTENATGSAVTAGFNSYVGTVYLEAGYVRLNHTAVAGFTDNYFGSTSNAVKVGILHTSGSGDNSGGVAGPVILDLAGAWTGMPYNFQLSDQVGKTLQINHAVASLPISGTITGGAGYGNASLLLDGGAASNVTVISGTVAGNGTNTTIGEVDVLAGDLQVDGTLYGSVVATANLAINGQWGATVNNLFSSVEKLTVTGALTLTGSLDLVGDALDASTTYILADYGSLTGEFSNYADGAAVGASHVINYAYNDGSSSNHIALTVVPEPGTLALLGVAGLLGLAVARRRRK